MTIQRRQLAPTPTSIGAQPVDNDLTTIAALDSTTAGALASDGAGWVRKTYAQLKTALSLSKSDVGLGNVDNTADTAKPVSTAQQTALDGKQPLDADLTTLAGLPATTDNFLQSKSSAWASRTPAQVAADLVTPLTATAVGRGDSSIFAVASVGHWFINPFAANVAGGGEDVDRLVLHALYSGVDGVTLGALQTKVNTAGTAGAVTRMGVYQLRNQQQPFKWASNSVWADLLLDAGTVTTTSTGSKIISPSGGLAVPANTWFAVGAVDQVATSTRMKSGPAGGNTPATLYGVSTLTSDGYEGQSGYALYLDGVSGTLPATFTPAGSRNQDSGVAVRRTA